MDINFSNNEITIFLTKISQDTINNFIENYRKLYEQLPVGRIYLLRSIEGEGLTVSNMILLMRFVKVLYNDFKKIHDEYINKLEFVFISQHYYSIFQGIFTLFPPKQKYEILFVKDKKLQKLDIMTRENFKKSETEASTCT